jgi:ribosomal RNA methyltransferase Nop2
MGRRWKNRQGDPEPLADPQQPGPKKLGKRKPDHEDDGRPAKKVKEAAGKPGKKSPAASKAKGKGKAQPKKSKVVEDDGDLGWEDMEDDIDLRAASKYVQFR